VTREDVMRAAVGGTPCGDMSVPATLAQAAMAVSAPGALGPSAALAGAMAKTPAKTIPAMSAAGAAREERIPFRGLRKKIAEKMHQSKSTAAHFTYVEDCDFTDLNTLRESLKPRAAEYGVKLTYLPFLFKAIAVTLRRHPKLNSMLDEKSQEWVIKHFYNIGISVDTPTGLIVPVVKQVESRSVLSIAAELQRVADEARAGKSKLEDLQGGTFTVTSVGNIGGVLATPIINFPEVAILGLNKIGDRPVVRDGQIVIRKMGYLAITLDHRLVDGADGARFMTDLVGLLENPGAMILELA
jgi:pyruvate dehydrogenase E2 component (dihydrolipoamide acetyltransferase)